ncbi:MAG TPA: hypothetical protein VFU88_14885 [Ktedonobacterales bacterium]|nr:hypothetical protein [Ktedonobacterales bacterium]
MIACPRCGQPCPPDAAFCASCHLMFAPGGTVAQQQGYGERETYGTHELSVRDLLSEDALPDWLREAGGGRDGQGYGQAPSAQAAPGYAAPAWGGQQPPQPGYGAAPGWGAPPIPQPGYGAEMPAWGQPEPGRGAPAGGMPRGPMAGRGAAQHLFDESALPDWLRQPGPPQRPALEAYPTLQQQMPAAGYGAPPPFSPSYAQPPQPYAAAAPFPRVEQGNSYQPPSPETSLTAQSLIDASALPGWLRGEPQSPQSPPANPNAAYRGANGLPGQSLVEESALPTWLRAEPASPSPAASAGPPNAGQAGQAGASIADWIAGSTANDALPPWLSQAYGAAQVGQAPPVARPPQAPAWPAPQSQSPAAAPIPGNWGNNASADGGLAASQLMDESALPDWLRAQGASLASPAAAGWPAPLPQSANAPAPRPPYSPALAPAAGTAPWGSAAAESQPVAQRFSASDLIDPDALPSWTGGSQEPLGAARDSFGAPPAPSANGSSWLDEGGYPDDPWGDPASRSARLPAVRRDEPAAGPRRVPRGGPLADGELPPWLQGGGPEGDSPPMGSRGARGAPPSWPVENTTYGASEDAGAPDGPGYEESQDGGRRRGRRGWRRRGQRE